MTNTSDYVVATNARAPHKESKQPAAFREKALPILPSQGMSSSPVDTDYFSNTHSGDSDEVAGAGPVNQDIPSNDGGGGVKRTTSLYKKVKGLGAKVSSR